MNTTLIMGIIGIICFVVLFIATIQFLMAKGYQNKLLLTFFVMLNFAIIARIVSFFVQYSAKRGTCAHNHQCVVGGLIFVNAFFYSSAIVVNLFNWFSWIIEINRFSINPNSKNYDKLKVILVIIIELALFLIFTLFSVLYCNFDRTKLFDLNRVNGILQLSIFLFLGICYALAGVFLYRKIKEISYSQAKQIKPRIIITVLLISVPIFFRAGINLVDICNNFIHTLRSDSINNDDFR